MTCEKCGMHIDGAGKFCGNCGAKVNRESDEFALCKKCGNKFKKEFGVCPVCGEAAEAEIGNVGQTQTNRSENIEYEKEEKTQGDSVKFDRQSKNGEELEALKTPVGVRAAMLEYLETKPYVGLAEISWAVLFFYPFTLFVSLLLGDNGFSSFVYSARFLLQTVSLFGAALCFAKSQSDRLAAASFAMVLCYVIKGVQDSFSFDYISRIAVYAIIGIVFVKDLMSSPERKTTYSRQNRTTGGVQLKWLLIGIAVPLTILGIMLLCSGKTCDGCGKYIFKYYEVFGKTFCKNCLYS